ncbi:MAG: mechanosensitive ion channel family protein [Bacteroidales bacterium]
MKTAYLFLLTQIFNTQNIIYYGIRILVVIIILLVARFLSLGITRYTRRKLKEQDRSISDSQINLIKIFTKGIIYFLAITSIMFTFPQLKGLGTSVFAGVGITAIIISIASQAAFSNIVSGFLIFTTKPFVVGDRIQIQGKAYGFVEEITIRHTIIRNFDNHRVVIPNSTISNETIINYNMVDPVSRVDISCGIGYESNHKKAFKIIEEEILNHPNYFDHRPLEEREKGGNDIAIRMVNWGDSSIDLKASFWVNQPGKAYGTKCDLLQSIKERFDNEDIDIPYPHRTIVKK